MNVRSSLTGRLMRCLTFWPMGSMSRNTIHTCSVPSRCRREPEKLLLDYNLLKGRVWSLFLLTELVSPLLVKFMKTRAHL